MISADFFFLQKEFETTEEKGKWEDVYDFSLGKRMMKVLQ